MPGVTLAAPKTLSSLVDVIALQAAERGTPDTSVTSYGTGLSCIPRDIPMCRVAPVAAQHQLIREQHSVYKTTHSMVLPISMTVPCSS
jgi:hypothetical protein